MINSEEERQSVETPTNPLTSKDVSRSINPAGIAVLNMFKKITTKLST